MPPEQRPGLPPATAPPNSDAQSAAPHCPFLPPFLPAWARHPAAAALALCAIIAVSFYPALFGGFVLDDNIFTDSPVIHAWPGLWNIWFSPADIEGEGHYWPIVYSTFWLEHKLWGIDPFGYHVVNVLLYMVSTVLLWHLLRRLAVPGAWAVAAVFAVHPMHVDSVAWVIGRKDLLSGLFYIAAALCWLRSMHGVGDSRADPARAAERMPRWGPYFAALALFAAAMLSKTVAVTLPVAFAIVLWWKHGRVSGLDACRLVPFFLVGLAFSLADLAYYNAPREMGIDYGFAERVLIAAGAIWFYAEKLVWPVDLGVIAPLWPINVADLFAWGWVIAALAVPTLLWLGRHRIGRGPLAGAVFFAVTLSPVLGFVDFTHMRLSFVADRYAYLAGIGFIAVLVGGAAYGAGRLPNALKAVASAVLVAVLAIFGKLTWDHTGIYRDGIAFHEHIISFNPNAKAMHRNLALALLDADRPREALDAIRAEVDLYPESSMAHNTHGNVLLTLDRLDEAEASFRRALELAPDNKKARHNMGELRRKQERHEASLQWYRRALDVDPQFALAHAGMGMALYELGRYAPAVESLRRAVSLHPGAQPLAHAGIGYALLRLERYEDALESLARAISFDPGSQDNADRRLAMGQAYQALGRTRQATAQYTRALEIDPRNLAALNALAWLHFGQQRYEAALGHYETLVGIDDADAQIRVNMAAALDYVGRPREALQSLERALSLDPALAETGIEEMRDALRRKLGDE